MGVCVERGEPCSTSVCVCVRAPRICGADAHRPPPRCWRWPSRAPPLRGVDVSLHRCADQGGVGLAGRGRPSGGNAKVGAMQVWHCADAQAEFARFLVRSSAPPWGGAVSGSGPPWCVCISGSGACAPLRGGACVFVRFWFGARAPLGGCACPSPQALRQPFACPAAGHRRAVPAAPGVTPV